jgi:hypothetical protein
MKSVLISATALLLSSGAANAMLVPFDDFSVAQGPITDFTVNGTRVNSAFLDILPGPDTFRRRITAFLLARVPPNTGSTIEVASGVLDIRHGAGERGENRVIYQDGAYLNSLLPLVVTNLALSLRIVASDANPATLDIVLDGATIGSRVIPANSTNLNFNIPINPATDFSVGNLEFVFNGSTGFDLSFDTFGLLVNVPAPAGVALFGLGLMALGLRRRG